MLSGTGNEPALEPLEKWPKSMFSYTSCGWCGMCASFTGGTHGTRMHYGKLETQCDALCKILLGNLCAIHVVAPLKCTTYLSIVAPQPFMEKISFNGCALIYQHNAATKQKRLRKDLRSITMDFRCWLDLQTHQSLTQWSNCLIYGTYKSNPWQSPRFMPDPTAHLEGESAALASTGQQKWNQQVWVSYYAWLWKF